MRNTICTALLAGSLALGACDEASTYSSSATMNVETTTEQVEPSGPISLAGQPNFRGLGGLETSDGLAVKKNVLYRSGALNRLTPEDVETLERANIHTVVCFVPPEEMGPPPATPLPERIEIVEAPIVSDPEIIAPIRHAHQTGDFKVVPLDINAEVHRRLIRNEQEQFATLLRTAADPDRLPMVFHCSQGVHRAGTGAAIILSAVGVPWETIREDYLVSNDVHEEETERRLAALKKALAGAQRRPINTVDMTVPNSLYILDGSYIDAARDEMIKLNGSVDAYIRDSLGITDEEIEQLRKNLLTN